MTPPPENVQTVLLGIVREPVPWNETELSLPPGTYLGGDPLRPYAIRQDGDRALMTMVRRTGLVEPPLVAEVLRGGYGLASPRTGRAWCGSAFAPAASTFDVVLPATPGLVSRLSVPGVLLVGLGDRDRYRGARLPLGIARLASWLRFTHAAHVEAIDYGLTEDEPLDVVREALDRRPGVIGVSVNFGQWSMLADIAQLIEHMTAGWIEPPVIVLGNILAAFSPEEAVKPFKRSAAAGRVFVATGLGEVPLETLCRALDAPETWADIRGLVPGAQIPDPSSRVARQAARPSLVAPDDGLVLAVAAAGGQVALETSLGCQYGACTFCPRDHKGEGWSRGEDGVSVAVLERVSRLRTPAGEVPAVSLVDEEFFGSEGFIDPTPLKLPAATILAACRGLGLRYEIYTRLEQLFDRRRSHRWNLRRALLLATEAPQLRRLFVGVESGSASQLRRYGKGQTLAQTVDALRVASHLGVPLEFGFITFDPLLTAAELGENLAFLARTDVICNPHEGEPVGAVAAVGHYLNGATLTASGEPIFAHVAYMATELEILARSRYADHLHRKHPDLLDGTYDPGFARYGARYADPRVGEVAAWCPGLDGRYVRRRLRSPDDGQISRTRRSRRSRDPRPPIPADHVRPHRRVDRGPSPRGTSADHRRPCGPRSRSAPPP